MNHFIKGRYGRPAFDSDVKRFFGLEPKDKWPEQGMPRRTIDGIHCWVDPLTYGKFTIRAKCMCPVCHKVMPIGRLAQHSKVHTGVRA